MYRDHRLAGSWDCLLARLEREGTANRWAQVEPALAADPRRLALELRRGTDRERADVVLGALVRLAAADGHDDPDAVLLLLHLLSPGVAALARCLPVRAGDRRALVVGELTVQIRRFPWRRRTRAYAANLLLDTRAVLLRELRPHPGRPQVAELLVDPTDSVRVSTLLDRCTGWPGDEDLDLGDVLAWATRTRVVDAADAALLVAVEQRRAPGRAAQLEVAREWGINERTLRRRRERALTALTAASARYLAECA